VNQAGDLAYRVFVNEPPLDEAGELLRTQDTAPGFFDAMIARYPGHLGRMILWVSARALYGVLEHPVENPATLTLSSWL
jgi:hypothetical protein